MSIGLGTHRTAPLEVGKTYRLRYVSDAIIVIRKIDSSGACILAEGILYYTNGRTPLDSLRVSRLMSEEIGQEYTYNPQYNP